MTILPRETERAVVLHMAGTLGANDMSRLHKHLVGLLSSRRTEIVLDFSEVDHVNYPNATRLAREFEMVHSYAGDLRIAGLSPYVRNILLLAGLHGFLDADMQDLGTNVGRRPSPDLIAS